MSDLQLPITVTAKVGDSNRMYAQVDVGVANIAISWHVPEDPVREPYVVIDVDTDQDNQDGRAPLRVYLNDHHVAGHGKDWERDQDRDVDEAILLEALTEAKTLIDAGSETARSDYRLACEGLRELGWTDAQIQAVKLP